MTPPPRWLSLLAAAALALGCRGPAATDGAAAGNVTVFAAASLREVAEDLAAAFRSQGGGEVQYNFAGSNMLARQITAAPAADVLLSADEIWVDFLAASGLEEPGSRRAIFSNRLVVISRKGSALPISAPPDLAVAPYRHLALADPAGVPAGRYARAALEAIPLGAGSLWESVADRVVPALDVRAALGLVESDPEIVGIVYATDAVTSDAVRVVCELPLAGAPITYWAVAVKGGPNPQGGRLFLAFLTTPEALGIGRRHGFLPPISPPPASPQGP